MNNDLAQFSEERLMDIIEFRAKPTPLDGVLFARIALAAKQAKPVGYAVNNVFFRQYMTASLYSCEMKQPIEMLYTTLPANSPAIPDGWIKCSDRMPENFAEVLVCVDYRSGPLMDYVDAETGCFFRTGNCATHWMPLPAAPKPESE